MPTDRSDLLTAFTLQSSKFRKLKEMDKDFVGVSLVIDHDKALIKKLGLKDKKYVALINVFLDRGPKKKGNKVQVECHVMFTIDSDQDGYPIIDQKKANLGANAPIDLRSHNDYQFDTKTKTFYKKGSPIEFVTLVEELFEDHLKPTKPIRGMILRLKIRVYKVLVQTTLLAAKLIALIYRLVFGEQIPYDFFSEYKLKNFPNEESIKKREEKNISIFGYTASVHLIAMFCFIHLAAYFIIAMNELNVPSIISDIFKSNFLTLSYSILTLYVLEEYGKKILQHLLKKMTSEARKLHEFFSAKDTKI